MHPIDHPSICPSSHRRLCFSSHSVFAGSYARYYYQFLVFRSMVGVGEASFSVLAPTLIADWYPAGPARTSALGFYCVSLPLGAATGFVYAGEVSRLLGWRYAFRISPVLSFALSSILLLTVAEPDRGVSDGGAVALPAAPPPPNAAVSGDGDGDGDGSAAGSPAPARAAAPGPAPVPRASWSSDVRAIFSSRSYVYSTVGAVGMTFTSGALAQWAPAFLQRVNCAAKDEDCAASVTRTFGLITMVTGIVGTMSGAQLARWYSQKNDAADAIVCAVGLLFATPCVYTAIYLAPRFPGYPTWSAILLGELLVSMVWAPNSAILLSVVSPERRSTASSIFLLTTHLFGDSMSPILIGIIADWFHASNLHMTRGTALQQALYLSVISTIVASFFFFAAGSHLALDRARAESTGYRRVDVDDDGGRRRKERDGGTRQADDRNGAPQFVLENEHHEPLHPHSSSAFDQVARA